MEAIPARHYCRNPRCRSKLSAPVPHARDAFCTKGCHSSFYLRRCLVCERELPTGRRSDAKLCRMPKCRSVYRQNPAIFDFRGLGSAAAHLGSKTPDFIDPKQPLKPDRLWHIVAGPKLSASAFHCVTVGAEQEPRRRGSKAIFHVPPLNVIGGYRFADTPAIVLTAPRAAMSKRRTDKGRIEGPFVPMLIQTTSSPAWRAMSPYAREVYRILKSRYSFDARNNGRIYVSTRDGAEETGFNEKTIARCFRELAHYRFIVMTEPGCLGVNGRGKAPHWRLTELGYMREPPTRDFLKWDGELFHEQKSPAYYKRQERCLAKLRRDEKQNPAPINGADCTDQRRIPVLQGAEQLPHKVLQGAVHIDEPPCTTDRRISRVNHSVVLRYSAALTDPWSDYSAGVYRHDINGLN